MRRKTIDRNLHHTAKIAADSENLATAGGPRFSVLYIFLNTLRSVARKENIYFATELEI